MIDPHELRVGNNVLSGGEISVPCVVRVINVDEENTYEPIELTPEVLKICGFECDTIITNLWSIPDWPGQLDFVLSLSGNFCLSKNAFEDFGNECKSVHQLQNLIFSLTGTELQYKP